MSETLYQENVPTLPTPIVVRGVLVGVGNIPLIPDTRSSILETEN